MNADFPVSPFRDRWGVAILICLLLVCSCCENQVQPPAPTAEGSLHNEQAQQARSFKVSSSGFLPTGLQGFQLGNTVADVRNRMPTLRGATEQESKDLYGTTSEGFGVALSFSENRLYRVTSELTGVSPRDADAFDRNTIMHLGKPNKNVYRGPEANCWVWIDGDVRVRYEDEELSDRVSRKLELEVVDYPALMSALGAQLLGGGGESKPDLIIRAKREWGEPSEPALLKPMPSEVDGLRLGMEPWEVRKAVPGIEITSVSEHEATGRLIQGRNSLTVVGFWDGRLYMFNRFHENIPAAQFASLSSRIAPMLGTPILQIESPTLVWLEWQDETIEISYMWSDPRNNIPPNYSVHAENKKMARFINSTAKPPQFNKAPQTRSFF